MSTPADLRLSSYDFHLPQERIAQRPVEPRHAARLLAVDPLGSGPAPHARHLSVWELQQELQPGDLLVVNDTRVLRARLEARRPTGGAVELLVLEPWQPLAQAGTGGVASGPGRWLCLAKPAKKLQAGNWIEVVADGQPPLPVQVLGSDPETGGRIVQFPADCADAASLEPLLVRYGAIPLPPYIHEHDASDNERYQTRYAARPGAVAAPTAGLHLSDALLAAIRARGVEVATTTLHVGLGTFRPVETEDLRQLELHSEWVEVTPALVQAVAACRARGGRVIAVGTTYRFAVVQGLLTNFHLPKSSLLLLVSALIGRERLLALYGEAIERQYRFFSYGDAMWIAPEAVLMAARPLDRSA
jgi:S-adenosylmethionine:tRNA ribosyltransferase-isomerase